MRPLVLSKVTVFSLETASVCSSSKLWILLTIFSEALGEITSTLRRVRFSIFFPAQVLDGEHRHDDLLGHDAAMHEASTQAEYSQSEAC
ncbi:hypothetical protein [Halomonas icarae]|uniref:hypothetical protein n=1 Tax=Halomonas icarae TaxID=2691040 RepID=UPI001929E006|nr:hypothetical protein [Halomonas icarae]MDR5902285.1 hypothetical protein [Halomonas icarae]